MHSATRGLDDSSYALVFLTERRPVSVYDDGVTSDPPFIVPSRRRSRLSFFFSVV